MIPRALARARLVKGAVRARYVGAGDADALALATALRALYRGALGWSRGQLDAATDEILSDQPDALLGRGLAHLLDGRAQFETPAGHDPPSLRAELFAAAAQARRGGSFDRAALVAAVAAARGLSIEALEAGLFGDLASEQRLVGFDDLGEERLLERYDLAQAQALVLDARRLVVRVRDEPERLRQVLRAAKFHRLLCAATRDADGLRLEIEGPLALFEATRRYGVQLANFLPSVLLARDYHVEALLRWSTRPDGVPFVIAPADGLVSSLGLEGQIPEEVAAFPERFAALGSRWRVAVADELIELGDGVLAVPDLVFHPPRGKPAYLELLGRWRRASAQQHLERLRRAGPPRYLVALARSLGVYAEGGGLDGGRILLIEFGQVLPPRKVLEALEALR